MAQLLPAAYIPSQLLTGSLSVEPWVGKSSGHRFPMKLCLVGPASSHSPTIPWASVSVYKEGLSDCEACENTNRPALSPLGTLSSRTDSKLTFSQTTCKSASRVCPVSRLLDRPLHPGLMHSCSLSLLCSYSEEVKSIAVVITMLKACDVDDKCWEGDVKYLK